MFLVVFKSSNPRSFSKLKLKLVGDPLEWDSWDAYSQSAEIIFQIKKKYFDIVTIIVFQCFHFDTTYILFFSLTILQSTGVYLKTENFDHFQYMLGI